jgi:hypothetical protein
MVEPQPSKLMVRVRFPSPAPWDYGMAAQVVGVCFGGDTGLGVCYVRAQTCVDAHVAQW